MTVILGLGRPAKRWGHHSHMPDFKPGENALGELMKFKASERKDDPSRRQGIHGPYETAVLLRTGKLPPEYYEEGDPEPWGLRIRESRSNILWQVLSGLMNSHSEFGTAYLTLALDRSLDDDDYTIELRKLNKNWGDFLEKASVIRDHHHTAMTHTYNRVSCPACSTLTALACQDAEMHALFMEMIPLSSANRRKFLSEKGLLPLLDTMIPEMKPDLKG